MGGRRALVPVFHVVVIVVVVVVVVVLAEQPPFVASKREWIKRNTVACKPFEIRYNVHISKIF